MADPATSLAETDAPDWMTPGVLATAAPPTPPVPIKTDGPTIRPFGPQDFLSRPLPTLPLSSNGQAALAEYQKEKPYRDAFNNAALASDEGLKILSNPDDNLDLQKQQAASFDPPTFLARPLPGADFDPSPFLARPLPGSKNAVASFGDAASQGFLDGVGSATRFAGALLTTFGASPGSSTINTDNSPNPFQALQNLNAQPADIQAMVPITSAFNATGTQIEDYAKTFKPDPNRPWVNATGQIIGQLAPVVGTSLLGTAIGQPEAGLLASSE